MDMEALAEAHAADNRPVSEMRRVSEQEKLAIVTELNAKSLDVAKRTLGKRGRD